MKTTNRSIRLLGCVLSVALLLTACNKKEKDGFTVTLDYKNLDRMVKPAYGDNSSATDSAPATTTPTILLEEVPFGGDMSPVILDSNRLTGKEGKVVLKGKGKEESIFQVIIQNGPMFLLINDAENIAVAADLGKRDNYYNVSGSEGSSLLKDFIAQYSQKSVEVNHSFAALDSLKQATASDSIVVLATEKKNTTVTNLNNYVRQFISSSKHPAVSLFALGWASRSFGQSDFEKSLNEVVERFPQNEALKSIKTSYEMQQAQRAETEKKRAGESWVGKMVPDLALPSPEGKMVSISSFRGKYLLVDFWASWCGPCRQENPNVVRVYNEFKNKNFAILGVSLDRENDKASWVKAIKDDQLTWTHISDLKYWNSKAVELFHIEGIPFNILVDPQGKIIGESLLGFDLEKKLAEVLK